MMEILKANFDDLTQILDLQKLCYQENAKRYNDFKIAPLVQSIEELKNEYTNAIILKAQEHSIIVGSIRAYEKDKTCYIGRVIVHPDYQNIGIGTKLMFEIESRFTNVSRYELFTGYKDEKNLYFYEKLGYKRIREENHGDNFKLIYLEKIK